MVHNTVSQIRMILIISMCFFFLSYLLSKLDNNQTAIFQKIFFDWASLESSFSNLRFNVMIGLNSTNPRAHSQPARKLEARSFKDDTPVTLKAFKLDPIQLQTMRSVSTLDGGVNFNANNRSTMTREKCYEKYGSKSFLPLEKKRLPPMFYTFPGSGNTWGRLLIEHATGIFSGSVYDDRTLLDALPGEFTCDWRVSVVKVHPHTHTFAELDSGHFNSDNNKCNRGNVRRFERAVLLIRSPWDAIWSEYQRRVTQSHVQGILKHGFDWPRWTANAAALSRRYHDMLTIHYAGIERTYKPQDVLYLRYESLKDKSTRVAELRKLADFLGVPVSKEQLKCAFMLSENTQAHRTANEADMTKDLAYTRPLVCRMWALLGPYMPKHNYTVWRDMDCSLRPGEEPFPAIQDVNVGPRGEYNREWVKPGKPLMDFGGHDDFGRKAVVGGAATKTRHSGEKRMDGRGIRRVTPNKGHGLRVMGQDSVTNVGGPNTVVQTDTTSTSSMTSEDVKTESKTESSGATTTGIHVALAGSMTLQQARDIPGVGKIGETKPAWDV